MMRLRSPIVVLAALFACRPADDRSAAPLDGPATVAPITGETDVDTAARASATRWVVTPTGYGPVLAGMPVTELRRALGESITPTYGAGSTCAYVRPAALPRDVLVMIERDSVARVDVRAKGVLTAEGVGVGDSEQLVLEKYEGRVRSSPHKYTGPTGHYLTASAPPDSTHLIVFETDGRVVTNYRAGRRPAVELVEGCS